MTIADHLKKLLRTKRPARIFAARLGESMQPPAHSALAACSRCRYVVTVDPASQAALAEGRAVLFCLQCGAAAEPDASVPTIYGPMTLGQMLRGNELLFPPGSQRAFSAWGRAGIPSTLVEGTARPGLADGAPQDRAEALVWVIQARDRDTAEQIYHAMQGWAPYVPMKEGA